MIRKFTAALLILLACSPSLWAENIELSSDQAKQLAQQQLAQNPAVTEQIALALLQGLPNDLDALMLLAAARIAMQNYDGAAVAAKRAFSVAPKGPIRMNAARLVSSAHFRAEHHTRAEFWLRRAMNNAPDAPSQQVLQRDFQIVRQANPLSVNLSFSLAPNSNINNGSNSEFIYIWNLPFRLSPDARALAGYEASATVDLRYRLSESQTQSTSVGLKLFGRTFEFTPAAAAAAPGISGSDYSFAVAELSFNHVRAFQNMSGPSRFGLTLGHNWYGGDPYTKYLQLNLGQDFVISERTAMQLTASGKHEISIRDGGITSDTLTLGASINHRLANGNSIGFSLGLEDVSSEDVTRENTAQKAGLNFALARPVLGMSLSANLSYESRDFGFSAYDPSGRQDETIGLGVTAVFVNMSFYGFSPSMTLEANKTQSNIGLFERESAGLRLGIQSTF